MGDHIIMRDGQLWHLNMWSFPAFLKRAAKHLHQKNQPLGNWLNQQAAQPNGLRSFDIRGFNNRTLPVVEKSLHSAAHRIGRKLIDEGNRDSAVHYFLLTRHVEATHRGESLPPLGKDARGLPYDSPAFTAANLPPIETLNISPGLKAQRVSSTPDGWLAPYIHGPTGLPGLRSPYAEKGYHQVQFGPVRLILDATCRVVGLRLSDIDVRPVRHWWDSSIFLTRKPPGEFDKYVNVNDPDDYQIIDDERIEEINRHTMDNFDNHDLILDSRYLESNPLQRSPVQVTLSEDNVWVRIAFGPLPPVIHDYFRLSDRAMAIMEPTNLRGLVFRRPGA